MTTSAIPSGFHTITPYLVIKDAARAIEFYKQAFAAEIMLCVKRPDGTIRHAEIKIGNSMVMLTDDLSAAPTPSPMSLFLYVEDVDAFASRAVAAGATMLGTIADYPSEGDRRGGVQDPFGLSWWMGTHYMDVSRAQMQQSFDDALTQDDMSGKVSQPPDESPQPASPKGYVLHPGEGTLPGRPDLKASRVSTGGSLTVIESHTDGGAPPHVHSGDDEYFYVLEGTLIVHCGDETFTAEPRAFVYLPHGVPHDWDVVGERATLLMMTAPAGLEEFLDEYHTVSGESNEIKDRVAAKYGITWIRKPQP